MEIRTVVRTAEIGTDQFDLVNRAIFCLSQTMNIACKDKPVPSDSTITLETDKQSFPARSTFGIRFLVRFVCPSGSYAAYVYTALPTEDDTAPTFFVEGGIGAATPENIFEAVFGQALQTV